MDSSFITPAPGGGQPAAANRVQAVSPLSGDTVKVTNDAVDTTLYLTPAGTVAALTVTLPSDANSRLGQYVRVISRQNITAITFNGAANIINAPASYSANDSHLFEKVVADTWIVVG